MPEMTMTEAAKWAGKSRTTMFKAIKSGKLSARRDDAGEFRIDPAELERVFKPAGSDHVNDNGRDEQADIGGKMAALQAENTLLRDQLAKTEAREAKLLGVVENQTRLLTDQRLPQSKSVSGWKFWKRS